ncbi:MAG: hypothetical protein NZ942_00705 [Candidatus Aenigmarchaeota archaeon]|nr:hypothetical protein [Candidatus Aenigmarchaeota archaeon]
MKQIIGAGCFVFGLLILISFPYIEKYQPEEMTKAGILIGILLMILGIILMKV